MTQQVKTAYRKHPRWAWAAALAVLAAAALAIVLPAIGATAGDRFLDATAKGVVPTRVDVGGSNFSCETHTSGLPAGMLTFKVSKPSGGTYTSANTGVAGSSTPIQLPAGVTVVIKGVNGPDKGKKFEFTFTGARVFHVGVNGGSDTAWFNYYGEYSTSGVTDDQLLHATSDNQGNLYTASWTTFCFARGAEISGKVWNDNDESKTEQSSEARQARSIYLYKKNGTSYDYVAQTTSDATKPDPFDASKKSYSFFVPSGSTYLVCEREVTGETWSQSVPSTPAPPATPRCKTADAANEGNDGYEIALTGDSGGNDFGNVAGVALACGSSGQMPGGDSQVQSGSGGNCKSSTTGSVEYVFEKWEENGVQYQALHPAGGDGQCDLSYDNTDTSDGSTVYKCTYFVQKLIWNWAAGTSDQRQNQHVLNYDDVKADGTSFEPMKLCRKDPRQAGQDFALTDLGSPKNVANTILPTGTRNDGKPHTSCLITTSDVVDADGARTRVDFALTVIDGRTNTP